MPRAQRRVAVNNTVAELNILNIFALSLILSGHTGSGRLERKRRGGSGGKPTGVWLEGWQGDGGLW